MTQTRDLGDKDDLINYQLLIIYGLLLKIFTYQPTVDKTIRDINQLLIEEGLLMIVDKVWKLTNTVRVGLDARSSHVQRQSTFPDNVCSYCPPVTLCHIMKKNFVFLEIFFQSPRKSSYKMGKSDEKTNTGEGGKGERGQDCLG